LKVIAKGLDVYKTWIYKQDRLHTDYFGFFSVISGCWGGRRKAEQNKERYKARVVGGAVAEDRFARGLCLPSGTQMTEEDLNRVVATLLSSRGK